MLPHKIAINSDLIHPYLSQIFHTKHGFIDQYLKIVLATRSRNILRKTSSLEAACQTGILHKQSHQYVSCLTSSRHVSTYTLQSSPSLGIAAEDLGTLNHTWVSKTSPVKSGL